MKNKKLYSVLLLVCIVMVFFFCTKTDIFSNPKSNGTEASYMPLNKRLFNSTSKNDLCSVPFSEYLKKIKVQNKVEQIKDIFKILDSRLLCQDEYSDVIKFIEKLLKSDEFYKYESSDFNKVSINLHLFKTKNMEVIEYEANPVVYGEVNDRNFAFVRQRKDNKTSIITLYNCVTKHIGYVYEKSENFLIVAGEDKYVNPYFAYIDGFSLSSKKAEYLPVLSNHTNSLWKITSDNGWVRRNSKENLGTSIFSASASTINIHSTDQYSICFIYDKNKKKYLIQG